jgi:LmbE family N-acetylglucosaminyl deacetylase
MFEFRLTSRGNQPLTVLCLGAHCDDIEIGCGGAVLRLIDEQPELRVIWVVFSSNDERAAETKLSANAFLADCSNCDVIVKNYRDGFLPQVWGAVKDDYEHLKRTIDPDVIFTHTRHDLHQDHRMVCELTWNTFRDHFILEYEIPKYDGDLARPNVFVPLTRATAKRKVDILLEHYPSQQSKPWFSGEVFQSLMRIRGMEMNSSSGLAEAFHGRKIILASDSGL